MIGSNHDAEYDGDDDGRQGQSGLDEKWGEMIRLVDDDVLGKTSTEKKRFLSGIARIRGGGLPMPGFFGIFLPSKSP